MPRMIAARRSSLVARGTASLSPCPLVPPSPCLPVSLDANPVAARLADLRRRGRKAFAPFAMAGYPSLEVTRELLFGLAAAGADLIELGLPFSDPLADGVTNQEAAQRALANGATMDGILSLLAETAPQLPCPVILFTYLNPVLQRGVEPFMAHAKAAGAAGLIVPDLPPEERLGVRKNATEHGLGLTFLVAPTSTPERIALAGRASTAFLYAVSLRGVTGAREDLPADLPTYLDRVREHAANPLLIGFGIGRPEQARAAAALSDGVIVASALVRLAGTEGVAAACALAGKMREAIDAADIYTQE